MYYTLFQNTNKTSALNYGPDSAGDHIVQVWDQTPLHLSVIFGKE